MCFLVPSVHEVMANDLANDHLPKPFQLGCESVPGRRRLPSYSNHAFNRLQCTWQYLDLKIPQAFIIHRTVYCLMSNGYLLEVEAIDFLIWYLAARSAALHAVDAYLAINDLICSDLINVSGMSGLSTSAPHLQLIVPFQRLFTQPTSAPDLT